MILAASDRNEKIDINEDSLCQYLDWDSSFFGLHIARLKIDCLTPENIPEILAWCRQFKIDCLYFLAGSADAGSIRLAEDNGFCLVDVRVTLERANIDGSSESDSHPGVVIRNARTDDLPALRSIARECFHDSRFYFDSHFSRSLCDSLYETWIEVSVNGYADAVLVAESEGEPAGFITCKQADQVTGEIGLLGVGSGWRGRGIGKALIMAGLSWFNSHRLQKVSVVTQGRNLSAQRLYQRCGFITRSNQLWYHKWFVESV